MVSLEEYVKMTRDVALYREEAAELVKKVKSEDVTKLLRVFYAAIGLGGEAGEVLNKIKKILRDSNGQVTDEVRDKLKGELGGTFWYFVALAEELGLTVEEIMQHNYSELLSRKERGVLKGEGDNR